MLQSAADEATRFLFKDHPWTNANFIEVLGGKEGSLQKVLFLVVDKGYIDVKNKCFQPEKPERGAPIRVKLFTPPASTKPPKPGEPPHGPPLPEFYEWEPRQDGIPFDCAKKRWGVVSHVNMEKQLVRVSLSAKYCGLLYFSTMPEAKNLVLGDVLIVYMNDLTEKAQNPIPILNFRKDSRHLVKGLYREFAGKVSIREGNPFGFVQDTSDIFVSPALVSQYHLTDSISISGWALCEWNKRKEQPGWSALTIESNVIL
jgi:hypothetical protein